MHSHVWWLKPQGQSSTKLHTVNLVHKRRLNQVVSLYCFQTKGQSRFIHEKSSKKGRSQDLGTRSPKLAIVKFLIQRGFNNEKSDDSKQGLSKDLETGSPKLAIEV